MSTALSVSADGVVVVPSSRHSPLLGDKAFVESQANTLYCCYSQSLLISSSRASDQS